jgi:hypothetical protein
MRSVIKNYGIILILSYLLGLGCLAVAAKISVGTAVSFPVDI